MKIILIRIVIYIISNLIDFKNNDNILIYKG
jgi:hypothetical protein